MTQMRAATQVPASRGVYAGGGKRVFDVVVAGAGIVLTLPLQAVLALLVRQRLGSPVLFVQERPGLDEKVFRLVKFRSMTDERALDGSLLPDEDRLPAFGRFLRSTSLDELPELYNVVRGDMSLVGPRPLLVKYLPLYTSRQQRRHSVRPGITGWAQVHGRNNAGWHDRLEMDVWYTGNVSLRLDLRILAWTVAAVLLRRDVTQDGEATAAEFTGSSHPA